MVVAIASFCVQSHVGYAIGVAAASSATLIAFLVDALRARHRKASWPSLRPGLLSVAALALFWGPPIYDEIPHSRLRTPMCSRLGDLCPLPQQSGAVEHAR